MTDTHIPYNHTVIGTCSLCRGPVVVPSVWGGVVAPVPKCAKCGGSHRTSYGPVIDMEPRQ